MFSNARTRLATKISSLTQGTHQQKHQWPLLVYLSSGLGWKPISGEKNMTPSVTAWISLSLIVSCRQIHRQTGLSVDFHSRISTGLDVLVSLVACSSCLIETHRYLAQANNCFDTWLPSCFPYFRLVCLIFIRLYILTHVPLLLLILASWICESSWTVIPAAVADSVDLTCCDWYHRHMSLCQWL